jgi:uracil-DNA glycosylase
MASLSAVQAQLDALRGSVRCPRMHRPAVGGRPVASRVILVGQAPGDKEPRFGRPFAGTAGKTLFGWFQAALGWTEDQVATGSTLLRFAAAFPANSREGGARVPAPEEIAACADWLEHEFALLEPALVIPVGKLAISPFLPVDRLNAVIGRSHGVIYGGRGLDCIPLPHPSGASTWRRREPGKPLFAEGLAQLALHPTMKKF